MSPIHRDGEGGRTAGATWESLVERLIREAQERGEFDDLPFRGRRIPLEDDSPAGELALGFHVLRNAGVAPPWVEADKEARRLLAERHVLLARAAGASGICHERDRRRLEELVGEYNDAVLRLDSAAPTTAVHRRPLSGARELAAWTRPRCGGRTRSGGGGRTPSRNRRPAGGAPGPRGSRGRRPRRFASPAPARCGRARPARPAP